MLVVQPKVVRSRGDDAFDLLMSAVHRKQVS
jgi:hypothetical protein